MAELMAVFGLSFLGVVAFAVLWEYSELPSLEWEHIAMGALFFLSARAVGVWASLFMGEQTVGTALGPFFSAWAGVFDVIGGALVIEGALRNAYDLYQE